MQNCQQLMYPLVFSLVCAMGCATDDSQQMNGQTAPAAGSVSDNSETQDEMGGSAADMTAGVSVSMGRANENTGGRPQQPSLGGRVATPPTPQMAFTHKMMKATGENMFASLGYECTECTFEQHMAIVPPEGWSKGPTQVTAFTTGEMRSRPSFEGVPDAMDFVPEVPGEEYKLIVKNLSAQLIERGPSGIVARAQVVRDTIFRYAVGSRVHELKNPDGEVFVLFAYQVDPTNLVIPDFQAADVLGDFNAPTGWTYTSRVLDNELVLDVKDEATVLAIRGQTTSTWQLRN